MIKNNGYITLKEVLSRVLRHPMLLDIDLEAAILYAVDFIHAVGVPEMFELKLTIIDIKDYKGELPCDLISINQVKDKRTNTCLRSMSDNFMPEDSSYDRVYSELTFKTLNTTIITSIKEGKLIISYKAIPVDDEGMPLLLDNNTYLRALQLYIKKEHFTILFDLGKLLPAIIQKAETDYAWAVGLLQSEMTIPSESEMETICRSWTTMMLKTTEFDNGFKYNGNRQYLKKH